MALMLAMCCAVAQKPNVLFIVVDDLAPVLSTYGYPVLTPNIERLKQVSTQFQNAYVSVAVCAPSRTAFLTGLRPDTTQVWTIAPYFRNTSRGKGLQVITLPQMFKQAGYNTTGCGKIFHPGTPSGGLSTSEGGGDMCPALSSNGNCTWTRSDASTLGSWTEPYWFCDQYTNDTVQSPAMQQWPCSSKTWPSCGSGCVQPQSCIDCFTKAGTWGQGGYAFREAVCPDECYPEGLIANRAIEQLEYHAQHPETPFFLAVGFKRPHLSYRAPKKYFDQYKLEDIPLPVHPKPSPSMPAWAFSHGVPQQKGDDEMGIKTSCDPNVTHRSDHLCVSTATNENYVRELRRAYYAVVSLTDAALGRVLDELESTGLANNTIVTFIGDHGYQNGEKGEWCKSNNFELAVRIPMYVSAPRGDGWGGGGDAYARGATSTSIVESVDLMPTLADMAGLPLPAGQMVAGESMKPLLLARDYTHGRSDSSRGAAARSKHWALSQWPRRPSCTTKRSCIDGHGDPFTPADDQALMGYTIRVNNESGLGEWRYTAWFQYDFDTTAPVLSNITARELYSHAGDIGDIHSGETFEFDNLAADPAHSATVAAMHALLVKALQTALAPPVTESGSLEVEVQMTPPKSSPQLDCTALLATNMDLHCPEPES